MKTKEELIKEFEEKVTCMRIYDEYGDEITDKVKDYIFNEMIPEVLEGILPEEHEGYLIDYLEENEYAIENKFLARVKQKVKENFGITL